MSFTLEDRQYLLEMASWIESIAPGSWMKDNPKAVPFRNGANALRDIARRCYPIPAEDEITFLNGEKIVVGTEGPLVR